MSSTTSDLHITGMSCQHCVRAVQQALAAVPDVTTEDVEIGRARVRYDPADVDPAALRDAVEEAGYEIQSTEHVA